MAGVQGQSQGYIDFVMYFKANAKTSQNAVLEPSDKKVNGCQHYEVFHPPLE